MTILWIYNMPLIAEAGGTERITSLVAKGMSQRGHHCMNILVFNQNTGKMNYEGKEISDLYVFLTEHKVDVVINQIAYDIWLLQSFLDRGGDKWYDEGGRIISCLHFDPCNPSYTQLFKSLEHPRLKDWITYLKECIFKAWYSHKKQRREGDIYNYIYEKSDTMVVLSPTHLPYMRKVMKKDNLPKLFAINNPLTFDSIYDKSQLNSKKNTILVCARMSEYHKRISIILKIWKRLNKNQKLNDWVLKIVGDGPDLNRYIRYANHNKLKNIQFLGHRSPEPYYREAKILFLTSSAEGWGLTLTEALQNGVVPVVMNTSSVYGEIIDHNNNGILVRDNNISEFTSAVTNIINNPELLYQMQSNAIESSRKFSFESTMTKWQQLLDCTIS